MSSITFDHYGLPIACPPCGALAGAVEASGILSFRGIPYAIPPIGDRRWRFSETMPDWQDLRLAKEFQPAAPQSASGEALFVERISKIIGPANSNVAPEMGATSEDCLYLNVFAPADSHKSPVMVWIHGGAFVAGSGADIRPHALVEQGVVVVTINYRLGILGFLAHPELSAESPLGISGNYGLMDQIEALRWVRRNIESFGGDPQNVTVFGVSAGAASIGLLLTSGLATGLFDKAICQSGFGTYIETPLRGDGISAELQGSNFAQSLGVKTVSELRAIPADELVARSMGQMGLTQPIVDGHVVAMPVVQSLRKGRIHDVPLLVGSNEHEGKALYWGTPLVSLPPPILAVSEYVEGIGRMFPSGAAAILDSYPANSPEQMIESSKRLFGDSLFTLPALLAAERFSENGIPTYLYRFSRVHHEDSNLELGAFHGAELSFVFDYDVVWPMSEEDRKIAKEVSSRWVAFALYGVPDCDGRDSWPTYVPGGNGQCIDFGAVCGIRAISAAEREMTFIIVDGQ